MYGYGVGLTAYLTRTLINRPSRIFEFTAKIPRGLIYALDSRSAKNAKKSSDYPRELTMAERRGMLFGPVAYVGSRLSARSSKPHTESANDGR